MPSVFKALASVTVWILFVFGILAVLAGFGRAFMGGQLPLVAFYFGYGIASLVLSVVTARLRKSLE